MLPKPGCGRAAGQDQVVTGIKLFCWSTWFWPICLGAGFPKDSSLAVNLKKSSVIFKIWDNARLKRCFISQQDSRPFHRLVYTVNLQERNVSDTTFHQLPSFTICLFIQSLNIYWEPSVVFKWGVCPNQWGPPNVGWWSGGSQQRGRWKDWSDSPEAERRTEAYWIHRKAAAGPQQGRGCLTAGSGWGLFLFYFIIIYFLFFGGGCF